jgi:hypothetical protein
LNASVVNCSSAVFTSRGGFIEKRLDEARAVLTAVALTPPPADVSARPTLLSLRSRPRVSTEGR